MSSKRKKNPNRPRPSTPTSQAPAVTGLAALKAAAGRQPGVVRAADAAPVTARSVTAASGSAPVAAPAPVVPVQQPPDPAPPVAPTPAPAELEAVPLPGPLHVTRVACGPVEGAEPQALGLTYWFDVPAEGPVDPVTVVFTGRRLDVQGVAGPGDSFSVQTTVQEIVAGCGRTSVTTRVLDAAAGRWEVAASQSAPDGAAGETAHAQGETAFAPVVRVRAPGVRLGAWPGLVATGTVLALITQALLSRARDLPSLRVFLLTVLACFIGVAGAKAYYLATHRGSSTGLITVGMSVQGFVLASIGTLSLGAVLFDLPLGTVLDVTTPGLLYGMTVGRLGCFLGGCCTGRVTASRWGLWSSDRRLGARRIPVQLMESAMAGVIATLALLVVLTLDPPGGLVFVGGISAYTLARQVLFPLRTVPRDTRHGRTVTMVLSGAVLLGDVVLLAVA